MAHNRLSRKRFATLLLACMMLLSFCAFVFAACATSDEDEDDATETRTDTQTFANADFEYFDDSDGSYLIGSAESWTSGAASNDSGTSASSSVAKSGIVDTSFDWGDATKGFYQAYADYLKYDKMQEDDPDNPELDDAEYYTDIDNYYDIPGWDVLKTELKKTDDTIDLTDEATIVEHATQIAEKAKALNPGTHNVAAETADEDNGTHVLMLHNYRTDGNGTAQKYTSSSITLAAGTTAKFSVWVNTKELTFHGGNEVNANRGAYIAVTNTVGGTTQDSLLVRNIITNGEWQQFTFYVTASDYAATTFAVELGLGNQDNGTSTNRTSYVQGYAFFDDLRYEVKTAAAYESDIANVPADNQRKLDLTYSSTFAPIDATKIASADDRVFLLDLKDLTTAALALTPVAANGTDYASGNSDGVRPTTDDRDNTIENGALSLSDSELKRLTDAKETDLNLSGWKTASEMASSSLPKLLVNAFENYSKLPFGTSDALLLYSSQGAPYTASASSTEFSLEKDEYLLISYWVKTSAVNGGTGATVSVVENDPVTGEPRTDTKTSIGAVDTTTLTAVDLTDDFNGKKGSYEDENIDGTNVREDIFDGWQQCFFFVANTTDEADPITFTLEFNYGITSEFASATQASFVPGYAAFAGFRFATMSEEQFNSKTTGTYAVEAALNGSDTSVASDFDDVAATDGENIETGFGSPANYQGTFGGSHRVGGDEINTETLDTAGLLNKDYAEEYFTNAENSTWMNILNNSNWYTGAFDQANWWNTLFGNDSTQPLLIVNTVAQSYGYIARAESSFSTDSYAAVTVRVKLSPGATANIYLIDTTAPETTDDDLNNSDYVAKRYTDTLKYGVGVSYRYDDNGNVINREPGDGFSSMNNTLFSYQKDNGLWLPYGSTDTSVYYANLANYGTDEDGNLVDSDDNIVYYASDEEGVYYRYYDEENDEYSVRVRDFTDADIDLTGAVLQDLSSTEKSLQQTVTWPATEDKVSDWIYVRFFVATGDEAKSYRLEVWSGDRTGENDNPANSIVAFEMVDYGTISEDTFNNLVSLRIDALIDAYNASLTGENADRVRNEEELLEVYRENPAAFANGTYGDTELIYFLYSLYDDDDYASYDADYSSSTTSPYADYDASSYSDTVSYLKTNYYSAANNRTYYDTYVNYGASEITVASSSDSGDDTTDDTTDNSPTYNVWLLVISIILAAVLIFTLIVLLIRKLLANMKKRPSKVTQSYDNKRKRYIRKLRLEEAEKDDADTDVLPEDDEITEEDIYKVETEDEQAEEPTEKETSDAEADEAQSESSEEKKDE